MPRPRATDVQVTGGRFFVKIPPGTGKKVYLTRSKRQSRRWADALEGIDDPAEALRRRNYLRAAVNVADEKRRLVELLTTQELVPIQTEKQAADHLATILNDFAGVDAVTDEMLAAWFQPGLSDRYARLLVEWGVKKRDLTHPRVFHLINLRMMKRVNPNYLKENPTEADRVLSTHFPAVAKELKVLAEHDRKNPSSKRLSHCLTEWTRIKGLGPNPPAAKHATEVRQAFDDFIRIVGNNPVNFLTKDDFIQWKEHVLKQQKAASLKATWFNKRMAHIRNVLRFLRKETSWPFPEPLGSWLEFTQQPYKPDRANRARLPVSIFKKLLSKADERASIDVEHLARDLFEKGRDSGNRMLMANCTRQAQRVQRQGTLFQAIVRLACNCGYDNVCVGKLKLEHLKNLTGDVPYVELGRSKVKAMAGMDVLRLTPLLPSTIRALQAWIAYAHVRESDYLFTSERDRQMRSEVIADGFRRLCKAAEIEGWTPKHLRNIGASLGKKHKRPEEERQAFLGHVVGTGTSRFYEDDVDETYPLDLVNLIGSEYFDGEQVGMRVPSG